MMTAEQHKENHDKFHKLLDENLAEFITMTGKLLSKTTLMEFLQWSADMIDNAKEIK